MLWLFTSKWKLANHFSLFQFDDYHDLPQDGSDFNDDDDEPPNIPATKHSRREFAMEVMDS